MERVQTRARAKRPQREDPASARSLESIHMARSTAGAAHTDTDSEPGSPSASTGSRSHPTRQLLPPRLSDTGYQEGNFPADGNVSGNEGIGHIGYGTEEDTPVVELEVPLGARRTMSDPQQEADREFASFARRTSPTIVSVQHSPVLSERRVNSIGSGINNPAGSTSRVYESEPGDFGSENTRRLRRGLEPLSDRGNPLHRASESRHSDDAFSDNSGHFILESVRRVARSKAIPHAAEEISSSVVQERNPRNEGTGVRRIVQQEVVHIRTDLVPFHQQVEEMQERQTRRLYTGGLRSSGTCEERPPRRQQGSMALHTLDAESFGTCEERPQQRRQGSMALHTLDAESFGTCERPNQEPLVRQRAFQQRGSRGDNMVRDGDADLRQSVRIPRAIQPSTVEPVPREQLEEVVLVVDGRVFEERRTPSHQVGSQERNVRRQQPLSTHTSPPRMTYERVPVERDIRPVGRMVNPAMQVQTSGRTNYTQQTRTLRPLDDARTSNPVVEREHRRSDADSHRNRQPLNERFQEPV